MQANETFCKHSLESTSIKNRKTKPLNALGKKHTSFYILKHSLYLFPQKHDKQGKT